MRGGRVVSGKILLRVAPSFKKISRYTIIRTNTQNNAEYAQIHTVEIRKNTQKYAKIHTDT